jgi:glucokinase
MSLPRTIDATQMRIINRSAVLELVRRNGPIARSQIGRQLGLSLPTVTRIIDQLIDEEMVRPTGESEWTSGRRRQLLEFNVDGHTVIGVDLGGTKMFGALANIGGEVVREISIDGHQTQGNESFKTLVNLIQELLDMPAQACDRVRGIAVGAPGITDAQQGVVEWAPSLNWRQFPLKQRLQQQFDVPIVVDNDVNLAVLGEHWFGAGQESSNLVLIAVGTGVGAGIMLDGALYRGHTGASGEIGYLIPSRKLLGKRYERFGALESIVSGTGIAERARQKLTEGPAPEEFPEISSQQVFEAARQGEAWAQEIVNETVDYLSIAIASVSTLLDPDLIVLGGGVAKSADLLIDPIVERITGAIPRVPRLVASSLGRRAVVMGGIVHILHVTDDYFVVRRLS